MENSFYSAFDRETLTPETPREQEYRSLFQIHRDRIIHTAAFRRLQGKTQVFLTGEYDFYRTRLTHSLEVSQIGRSICAALRHHSPHLAGDFYIDPDLVEAACLAHDLGHPPFGHAGERSLHRLMGGQGGFEGNAQTLRLLTETIFSQGRRGMNPSRALLDAVLKYKQPRHRRPDAHHHFIYDEQEKYLRFVHDGDLSGAGDAVGGTDLQSIECQIMDWADDTAYSLNDMADGVAAGFVTVSRLEKWAESASLSSQEAGHVTELATAISADRIEIRSNRKIGDFIAACSLSRRESPLTQRSHRHAFTLAVDPAARAESSLYKRIAHELVFRTPQLQQLDFKADQVLARLHEALFANYLTARGKPAFDLLPRPVAAAVQAADERQRPRLLCDFLADQTDNAASRLCLRLFDPNFGSILDLL